MTDLTLSILRRGFGFLLVLNSFASFYAYRDFYSDEAALPVVLGFGLHTDQVIILAVFLAQLIIGLKWISSSHQTFLSSLIGFLAFYLGRSFNAVYVTNAGDTLFANVLFLNLLGSFGTLEHKKWTIHLIRFQVCVLYWVTASYKLLNSDWTSGLAIYKIMQDPYSQGIFLAGPPSLAYSIVGSYLTMLLELALPFILWIPKLRAAGVLLGISFHLSLLIFLNIPFFQLLSILLLLAFANPKWLLNLWGKMPKAIPTKAAYATTHKIE